MSQIIDCPHCEQGTVTKVTGPSRWQRIAQRCAYCAGTGRIITEPARA